jgi:hypothetical protein
MELERPTDLLRKDVTEKLRAEAERMEVDPELYIQSTPRERGLLKARAHRQIKNRARKVGLNPEDFLDLSPEDRVAAEQEAAAPRNDDDEEEEEEEEEVSGAPRVFSEAMDVPADDMNPSRRNGVTIGTIVDLESPDLVGDQPPLTLADLYARWPIGRPGGEDFYIRVERIQPKKFQEINCAGFLANVRRLMNEEQFGRWFGGREYHLTIYGPNPRGRRDANGDVIIKRLTQPIHVVVPHVPPNLNVMPAVMPASPGPQEASMFPHDPSNPFATIFPHPPMTSADANIHASSLKFAENMFRQQQEELKEARRGQNNNNGGDLKILGFASDMTKTQVESAQRDAERREQILRDQMKEERATRREMEQELRSVKERMEQAGLSRSGESIEFLKFGDQAAQRQSEYYRQQLDNLQRSHEESLKLLRQSHDEELKRERERLRDLEEHFKRVAEDDRRAAADREKSLREEVERIRREERDSADRRVADTEKVAEQRYRDQEKAHERELRTIKDNMEVRYGSEKNRLEFELVAVKERMEETKSEMSRIREESDPVQIIEKRRAEMKALGFVERDPEAPTSVWERFAQAAGGGVGQFLARADLGQVMGAISAMSSPQQRQMPPPGARPQLPPGPQQQMSPQAQQQMQQAQVRRRRAETWASQGSPVAKAPTQVPNAPPIMHAPVEQPAQAASVPQPQQPDQAAPPVAPQPAPVEPPPASPPQIRMPRGKFHAIFDDQAILAFLQNVEGAINMGFPPKEFAQRLYEQLPEQSMHLVQGFTPEDAIEYVRSIPEAAGSPILRRDGAKWLHKLWPAILEVAGSGTGQQAGTG